MGIGNRIKEAREQLGLTQIELGKLVGVTGSAITNYEKETSHPKEQIIYKLMETLNVDANYLFQDVVKIKSHTNDVTLAEYDMVKRYRTLDDLGKETIEYILNKEVSRTKELQKKNDLISELKATSTINGYSELEIKAAHNDYESDPSEQEKMRKDLSTLKRPK